ncbi:MAG: TonB family protein [Candidatus Sulfotelmatobacter sp.]
MAPHPMSDPGWSPAAPDGSLAAPESAGSLRNAAGFESDLAELAAKFAAHGGESFPADLSAELALEIVLNEIVEQACLATGATGAAVVLDRDGEMVCRASSGPTAPELGARQDVASGLSGECIRTGQTQRCDDAQTDPRADATASQRLGVRSALVLPLIGANRSDGNRVVGLFEVFSPRAWAFGDRDERTLEALSVRVMRNLERAAEPLVSLVGGVAASPVESSAGAGIESGIEAPVWSSVDGVPAAELLPDNPQLSWETTSMPVPIADEPQAVEAVGPGLASPGLVGPGLASPGPGRRFDVVGWALGAVVLACTVLMAALVVERMEPQHTGSTRTAVRRPAVQPTTSASGATNPDATIVVEKNTSRAGAQIPAAAVGSAAPAAASAPVAVGRHARPAAPAGSLLVFENGKEVFRMPPSQGQAEPPATVHGGVEQAASVTPERVVALSQAAAENSLIHRVEPDYPEEARNRQLQGAVVLDIHIGQDGTVQETKLVSGEPLLADAAMAAVRQWRFRPRLAGGAPAEMQTRITLNFRLSN